MKVHIIGIAGKATSGIAKMFKDLNYEVTGSDQGIYPPVSTFLEQESIKVSTPYSAENIDQSIDFIVVGGNANLFKDNPEIIKAKQLKIPFKTYPDILEEFVVKENSIVVVGNYGKGTITGAIVKALRDLGQDPSYMIGGQLVDESPSLHIGVSNWSVIEGDEYPEPNIKGDSPKSKFFYYHPKYLVLTSAEWDHFDQFPSHEAYIQNYINLVKTLPQEGLLVSYYEGEHLREIIRNSPCRVVTYDLIHKLANYVADSIGFEPQLLGRFNKANLTAVYTLLVELGFDPYQVKQSLNSYKGLVQRMNVIHEDDQCVLIRDYAHSPIKAKSAILAAKEHWPNHSLIAVFDIYASSLKNRNVLDKLSGALTQANFVLIPKVKLISNNDQDKNVTGGEIVEAIKNSQPNVKYLPKIENLIAEIINYPNPKVILLMSSGGMDGLDEKLDELLDQS